MTVRATRGITAGAGFATVELELLLYDTISQLHGTWSHTLVIKVYIDDITLTACGQAQWIVKIMIEALDFLVAQLEDVLLMQVSASKSKVLAGRPCLAQAVIQMLQTNRLSTTKHAKLLGVDSVGGRRRSTITFQDRVSTFTKAVPRLQALRKVGVNSMQMVRTAGTPAVMYGCEIMGLSDSALYLARCKIAAAAASIAGGKNPELVLHTLDGPAGTMDPAFEAHSAPVLFWAMAVWCQWFTRRQMGKAF